ncbi:MAG: hypothetical protein QM756_33720 [Polyangiaceae bacterium]
MSCAAIASQTLGPLGGTGSSALTLGALAAALGALSTERLERRCGSAQAVTLDPSALSRANHTSLCIR